MSAGFTPACDWLSWLWCHGSCRYRCWSDMWMKDDSLQQVFEGVVSVCLCHSWVWVSARQFSICSIIKAVNVASLQRRQMLLQRRFINKRRNPARVRTSRSPTSRSDLSLLEKMLSDSSGVRSGTLYSHFREKDSLCLNSTSLYTCLYFKESSPADAQVYISM